MREALQAAVLGINFKICCFSGISVKTSDKKRVKTLRLVHPKTIRTFLTKGACIWEFRGLSIAAGSEIAQTPGKQTHTLFVIHQLKSLDLAFWEPEVHLNSLVSCALVPTLPHRVVQ